MAGILPESTNGGLQTRDSAGNPIAQPSVQNAYNPPASFATSCSLNYLPSDCTARITAAQINAITAELLCFMASINPDGSYNCGSTCNLASNFAAWQAENGRPDNITIGGTGTTADPFRVLPAGLVAAICADDAAADALAACLISTSAGNLLDQGGDGRLFIDAAAIVAGILASDVAGDQLAAGLISSDLNNSLTVGTDGKLYVNVAAPTAAPACMNYTSLIGVGTDGLQHTFPRAQVHTGAFAQEATNGNTHAVDVVSGPVQRVAGSVFTVNNPNPCADMYLYVSANAQVTLETAGSGGFSGQLALLVNGTIDSTSLGQQGHQGRPVGEGSTVTFTTSHATIVVVPAGGSITYQYIYTDEINAAYAPGSFVSISVASTVIGLTI